MILRYIIYQSPHPSSLSPSGSSSLSFIHDIYPVARTLISLPSLSYQNTFPNWDLDFLLCLVIFKALRNKKCLIDKFNRFLAPGKMIFTHSLHDYCLHIFPQTRVVHRPLWEKSMLVWEILTYETQFFYGNLDKYFITMLYYHKDSFVL